ncbi:hypothetical protein DM02DRAFT_633866 [Periconia macrospinosa]|uniref:Protein ROT1 n=1 Tax=Periconia macrospinosa TaxID=97972 RepID=A0A2V1D842_9PLEO|nr:hypothetical protein DM02DRAFT_633866 [Periconia macrospinosa]
MVLLSVATLLLSAGAGFATAQTTDSLPVTDLVGTWSSKSNSTLTGPGFYDPIKDSFIEPKHTGISYSFTADGHYEEAYYRAIANRTSSHVLFLRFNNRTYIAELEYQADENGVAKNPKCPKGIIQWQHGTFKKLANGSLELTPIETDGRQMYSDPCSYKTSVYTRYKAKEHFKQYEVLKDPYHQISRLNLFKWDGAPMMPLYLAMSPPTMLPTTTLNPTNTPTPSSTKQKRSEFSFSPSVLSKRSPQQQRADRWWWLGVVLTMTGGTLYFVF